MIFLSLAVSAAIIFFPFLLIIFPDYQQHLLLNKERGLWESMQKTFSRLPGVVAKKAWRIQLLQEKLEIKSSLPLLESDLIENKLFIESMKSRQGEKHDELHLKIKGQYRDLLRFLSLQSRSPSAMEIVYLSIDKGGVEIIFKADAL